MFAYFTDIDFINNRVKVSAKPELGFKPKNKKERWIPVPASLIVMLKARCESYPKSRLIFPRKDGQPEGHMLRKLKSLAARAGFTEFDGNFGLHKFRKTFATTHHPQWSIRPPDPKVASSQVAGDDPPLPCGRGRRAHVGEGQLVVQCPARSSTWSCPGYKGRVKNAAPESTFDPTTSEVNNTEEPMRQFSIFFALVIAILVTGCGGHAIGTTATTDAPPTLNGYAGVYLSTQTRLQKTTIIRVISRHADIGAVSRQHIRLGRRRSGGRDGKLAAEHRQLRRADHRNHLIYRADIVRFPNQMSITITDPTDQANDVPTTAGPQRSVVLRAIPTRRRRGS